jgi:hypothetical protein
MHGCPLLSLSLSKKKKKKKRLGERDEKKRVLRPSYKQPPHLIRPY